MKTESANVTIKFLVKLQGYKNHVFNAMIWRIFVFCKIPAFKTIFFWWIQLLKISVMFEKLYTVHINLIAMQYYTWRTGFYVALCVYSSSRNLWLCFWGLNQSPLYGRVTKKYDIYWNNNKKTQVTLEILRLLAQKKIFYEVNFFHFLIKLNSSLI